MHTKTVVVCEDINSQSVVSACSNTDSSREVKPNVNRWKHERSARAVASECQSKVG